MRSEEMKATVSIIGGIFSTVAAWACYLVSRFLLKFAPAFLGLTESDKMAMALLAALACIVVCAIELRDARDRID